ncbi:MAG: hypothetical protein PHT62_08955 [Desulfotomaculaceae bacterium]|nr:hypothetical protein [Desulfotomaculaceae bacterium]
MEAKTKNFFSITFFAMQFIILIVLINTQKFDYLRDVIFITTIAALYLFLEAKFSISVSNYIRGCLVLVISVHEIGGKIFELYLRSAMFDKYLHVFGIYSLVLFVYAIMRQFMEISFKSRLNKFIFLTLVGISLGAFFEIMEFMLDITLKPKLPNQKDLMDTNLDLIADCVGALIAAFHLCFIGIQLRLSKDK